MTGYLLGCILCDTMLSRFFGRKPAKMPSSPKAASQPSPILDVSDADFAERVEASSLPVVVDVWAEWCQPCQTMSAYVGFLAQEYQGRLIVAALDADENLKTSERFQILGLPTLLFFKNGAEVDRIVGLVAFAEIKARAESLISNL